jgi:hypothetical protein
VITKHPELRSTIRERTLISWIWSAVYDVPRIYIYIYMPSKDRTWSVSYEDKQKSRCKKLREEIACRPCMTANWAHGTECPFTIRKSLSLSVRLSRNTKGRRIPPQLATSAALNHLNAVCTLTHPVCLCYIVPLRAHVLNSAPSGPYRVWD